MRFFAALSFCLLLPVAVEAKPTRDLSGEFRGDRYVVAYGGGYARDVAQAVKKQRAKRKKQNYRPPGYPVVKFRPRKTLVGGFKRELKRAVEALPRLRGRGDPITFRTIGV